MWVSGAKVTWAAMGRYLEVAEGPPELPDIKLEGVVRLVRKGFRGHGALGPAWKRASRRRAHTYALFLGTVQREADRELEVDHVHTRPGRSWLIVGTERLWHPLDNEVILERILVSER